MPLIGRWRPLAAGDKIPTDSGTQELEGFSMFRKVTVLIYYCNVDKNICMQAITSTVFILSLNIDLKTSADPKSNFSRYSTWITKGLPPGDLSKDPDRVAWILPWIPTTVGCPQRESTMGIHDLHPRWESIKDEIKT